MIIEYDQIITLKGKKTLSIKVDRIMKYRGRVMLYIRVTPKFRYGAFKRAVKKYISKSIKVNAVYAVREYGQTELTAITLEF